MVPNRATHHKYALECANINPIWAREGGARNPLWDHSFSTFTKFSEKLTFLTYVYISRGKTC